MFIVKKSVPRNTQEVLAIFSKTVLQVFLALKYHFGPSFGSHFGSNFGSHFGSHFRSHFGSHFGYHFGSHFGSQLRIPKWVPKWFQKRGPKWVPKWVPKWDLNGDPRNGIQEMGSKKWDPKNFEKSEKLFLASNATQGFFGHQMPPWGIWASNATRGYWGVKCHPWVLGRQVPPPIYWGVKGQPEGIRASKARGVKNQGRQRTLYG